LTAQGFIFAAQGLAAQGFLLAQGLAAQGAHFAAHGFFAAQGFLAAQGLSVAGAHLAAQGLQGLAASAGPAKAIASTLADTIAAIGQWPCPLGWSGHG
jgi:hypothetical protein